MFVDKIPLGSISSSVYEDSNNNNAPDVPIDGVLITLTNLSGAVIATTLTDTSGFYVFIDLLAGQYIVKETAPKGYLDMSDMGGGDPNTIAVALGGPAMPLNSMDNNFVEEKGHSVTGVVLEDLDNNDT